MAGGAGSRIAAAPATGSAGEECGERCKLTYDRFASFNGVEGLPTGRVAAPGGDRRGNGAPGDGVGSAGQPATLDAVVEGRGVEGVHKRSFGGVEGSSPWAAMAAMARSRKRTVPFIGMNSEALRR
jgi:hypothetical protein